MNEVYECAWGLNPQTYSFRENMMLINLDNFTAIVILIGRI